MRYIHELFQQPGIIEKHDGYFLIKNPGDNGAFFDNPPGRYEVHLLGLGDVGKNLAIGLRLLGAACISRIGLWDLDETRAQYMARELNQIVLPEGSARLPKAVAISERDLCNCHVLIFAASKSVPPVDDSCGPEKDVRMVQLLSNAELVKGYVDQCREQNFTGNFFVVSDPVDPLCKIALDAFDGALGRNHIAGFGLGVMYARAGYHASDPEDFWENGRVYGPHGKGLVAVNSWKNYHSGESAGITRAAVTENLTIRGMGFKPNIAPAFSSGAISIVEMLQGHWHYSSVYFGDNDTGAFLGIRNKLCPQGRMVEDIALPEEVFSMIASSYHELKNLEL